MEIKGINMCYGDSFIITWEGTDGEHTLLLDSGDAKSYKSNLRGYIEKLKHHIDLWIISHPHDDHIRGVMEYIEDLMDGRNLPICKHWLFNPRKFEDASFDYSTDGSYAVSWSTGDKLSGYLRYKGFQLQDIVAKTGSKRIIDGLELNVVTPIIIPLIPKDNISEVSDAMSSVGNDYDIKIECFDINTYDEDKNDINSGSISLILRHNRQTFFWMADSKASIICDGLKLLGYSKEHLLLCDAATLPHHGSKANANLELLSLLKCNTFIVTANGENKYNLPNKETLVRVLNNPLRNRNEHITFYLPDDNATLKSMFDIDGDDVFDKWNFEIKYFEGFLNLL